MRRRSALARETFGAFLGRQVGEHGGPVAPRRWRVRQGGEGGAGLGDRLAAGGLVELEGGWLRGGFARHTRGSGRPRRGSRGASRRCSDGDRRSSRLDSPAFGVLGGLGGALGGFEVAEIDVDLVGVLGALVGRRVGVGPLAEAAVEVLADVVDVGPSRCFVGDVDELLVGPASAARSSDVAALAGGRWLVEVAEDLDQLNRRRRRRRDRSPPGSAPGSDPDGSLSLLLSLWL